MHKMLQPSDPATRAILQMEVDQAEARAPEHVQDERRQEQAGKLAAERAEAMAQDAIEVHFANPLPGEWTGRLTQTKLVVIRKMAPVLAAHGFEQGHRYEAVEYHGGTRAVTRTAHNSLSYEQDMELLTRWAAEWNRGMGLYTPAWVFVPVLEHAGQRFYAGVRPSAGMAFAHVVKHECWKQTDDFTWRLTDMDGELVGPPDLPEPVLGPHTNEERFEWPDGSAIVSKTLRWDFGFHRDELTDPKVIEQCQLLGDEPRFAWPSDLG